MAKTIRQFADELEVTKQAIQYQVKKIDSRYVTKSEGGAYLIHKKGQALIKINMGLEENASDKKSDKSDKQTDKILSDDLSVETLAILQKELAEKNEQINKLQELLKEQQNLLSQQQQLTLQSNRQIEHLQLAFTPEINESSESKTDAPASSDHDKKQTKESGQKQKKGFFSRLFNR
ncbi:hypothetical protein BW727_200013 (plasmid) [Jeotgalibaca dankookensis]|uniref:DUF536 domain-containing protein n=1 Tax=Jeotgalibaca dankookensis TaxID=708126 RepID=A0A1S6IS91_9LACT|nr:hypothetical protein [Jeotgalibaca dankookensis]AQS54416.1 hypothetical protein BW727_200013 [Jeotgalibaca dankookensis]